MMVQLSDRQLLERFRECHDPELLGEIVRRYIGLVHSAARRQVRDPHLAADVVQAVFIVLVRKADSLRADTVLPAWLFSVTRHAIANAQRVLSRRRFYETRKALIVSQPCAPPADADAELVDEIRCVMDDGIAQLSHVERSAVLMHFFAGKTHREVGEALGVTEEAARKRLNRGLEKLRALLVGRAGGNLAPGAPSSAAIASVIAAEGATAAQVASQPTLVTSTTNVALLADSTAHTTGSTGAGAIAIAQGVFKTLRVARVKLAVVCAVALALSLTVTSLVARRVGVFEPRVLTRGSAMDHEGLTTVFPRQFQVAIDGRSSVRLLGVSPFPPDADSWFAANGQPIGLPDARLLQVDASMPVPAQYELAMLIENPAVELLRLHVNEAVAGANVMFKDENQIMLVCLFTLADASAKRVSAELGIAESGWQTIAANERPEEAAELMVVGMGQVTFEPIEADSDSTRAIIRHGRVRQINRLIAVANNGNEYLPTIITEKTYPPNVTTTCTFDLRPDQIRQIALQTLTFNRFVRVNEISLEQGFATNPTMSVGSDTPPATTKETKR